MTQMRIRFFTTLLFSMICLVVFGQDVPFDVTKYSKQFPGIDMSNIYISDQYSSKGISHVYFQQAIEGVPVVNSHGSIHFGLGLSTPYTNDKLIRGLENIKKQGRGRLSATESLIEVAKAKGYDTSGSIQAEVVENSTRVIARQISTSDVLVSKVYYLKNKDLLVPAFEMTIDQVSDGFFYKYIVDANTGEILDTKSLTYECSFGDGHDHKHTSACSHGEDTSMPPAILATSMTDSSYNVFAWPVESPNFGTRTLEVKPWEDNPAASPDGWHDINGTTYTVTTGNNVDAYRDDDNDNSNNPPASDTTRVDGGAALSFDNPLDVTGAPTTYRDAAITNLFYWSNVVHDVMYNYGFDEPSGNFQAYNYTSTGIAGDNVNAEAQDTPGTCNANFGTPADGGNPRMQMYLCNGRDGDYDNGVVVHEYGHGISNRLTGGPALAGCLGNEEQMGEGWSDYFGMVMTIEADDAGTDSRGMGTWLFGEGPDGDGIRPFPYSTDMNINPATYATISNSSISVPHGVGSIWATMLWDMTWALIDEYGFDPDIYEGTGGNNIALALVMEGLKLQPCSPGFVDGRDAIIAADMAINGGANECLIWEVFANRGLGFSALQGSTGSRSDGTEAFDLPPSCSVGLQKTADVTEGLPGDNITYKLKVINSTASAESNIVISDDLPANTIFVSATDGGLLQGGSVVFPAITLAAAESDSVFFTVQIDPNTSGVVPDIIDDLENGTANWSLTSSGSTSFNIVSNNTNSGSAVFFANDGGTPGIANIDVAVPIGVVDSTTVSFFHSYDTEDSWDGGVVEISIDEGSSWVDLGDDMITNGYDNLIYNSRPGFSGNSGGYINTVIDLGAYAGNSAILRFQMNCDQAVAGNGWWIDDISIINMGKVIPNTASMTSTNYTSSAKLAVPTKILVDPNAFFVSISKDDVSCNGLTDGTATANPQGGSLTYTYVWNTGATTQQISALSPGIYTVTVSDGITTQERSTSIFEPTEVNVDAYSVSVSAAGLMDGSVAFDISGGVLPLNILWSNGATTQEVNGLTGGEYSVLVTDNAGCMGADTTTVVDPTMCTDRLYELKIRFDQHPEDISYSLYDDLGQNLISREGIFDNVADGDSIVRYFCLPEACYSLEISDAFGDGLCASYSDPLGSYSLILMDNGEVVSEGCAIQTGAVIDFCAAASPLNVEATISDVSCNGTADGTITAQGINGSGQYAYSWSNGATSAGIINLAAGLYTVTVSDGQTMVNSTYEVLGAKFSRVIVADDDISGSLRDVLANGCDGDTVLFADNLMNQNFVINSGELLISDTKVIVGLGISNISLDAKAQSRIFNIDSKGVLTLLDMKILDGSEAANGGNILNRGSLSLERVLLEGGVDQTNGPRQITNLGVLNIGKGVIMKE